MVCNLFGAKPLKNPFLLPIVPPETIFSEIWIKIHNIFFQEMYLKL